MSVLAVGFRENVGFSVRCGVGLVENDGFSVLAGTGFPEFLPTDLCVFVRCDAEVRPYDFGARPLCPADVGRDGANVIKNYM